MISMMIIMMMFLSMVIDSSNWPKYITYSISEKSLFIVTSNFMIKTAMWTVISIPISVF